MVVIQEHKTHFVSSRLHLPHCVWGGEEEPTATFCHINYISVWFSGNGIMQHTLNSCISKMACCLFVTEETDEVNLSVS